MNTKPPVVIGDCRDAELIDALFGSVSEFARLVELLGDNFTYNGITVQYIEDSDIHNFFEKNY